MKYIFGNEDLKIEAEVKNTLKNFDGEVLHFGEDSLINDIALALETPSFFSDKKIVIIKNHASIIDVELGKKMLVLLSVTSPDTEVVFINSLEKTPASNPLIKYLNNNAKQIRCDHFTEKEMPSVISQMVQQQGGQISFALATKIASLLPNDLMIITNEISNLITFNPTITESNIEKIMSSYFDDDYFAFSNAIIEGDAKKIISLYKEKTLLEEDVVTLIGQIASALTLALNIYTLKMTGISEDEISQQLKVHIFRIKKANKLINKHGVSGIKKLIVRLANLDRNIKQGNIDKNIGFGKFILDIIR